MRLIVNSLRRIRKVIGGGAVNVRKDTAVGLQLQTRLTAVLARPVAGLVQTVRAALRGDQPLGLLHQVFINGDVRQDAALGLSLVQRIAPAPFPAALGKSITQFRFNSQAEFNGLNAAGYAVGPNNDFAGVANFNGRTASEASLTGGKGTGGLSPKGGGIRASFEAIGSSKDNYAITEVLLRIYLRQTGTLLDNGTLIWGVEGSVPRTQLGAATGDIAGEQEHDLTALIGNDWSMARELLVWVEGSSAVAGRSVFARYAYQRITSQRTEDL